jgi:hypothetical protein
LNFPECALSKKGALVEWSAGLKFMGGILDQKSGGTIYAVPSDVLNNEAMKC